MKTKIRLKLAYAKLAEQPLFVIDGIKPFDQDVIADIVSDRKAELHFVQNVESSIQHLGDKVFRYVYTVFDRADELEELGYTSQCVSALNSPIDFLLDLGCYEIAPEDTPKKEVVSTKRAGKRVRLTVRPELVTPFIADDNSDNPELYATTQQEAEETKTLFGEWRIVSESLLGDNTSKMFYTYRSRNILPTEFIPKYKSLRKKAADLLYTDDIVAYLRDNGHTMFNEYTLIQDIQHIIQSLGNLARTSLTRICRQVLNSEENNTCNFPLTSGAAARYRSRIRKGALELIPAEHARMLLLAGLQCYEIKCTCSIGTGIKIPKEIPTWEESSGICGAVSDHIPIGIEGSTPQGQFDKAASDTLDSVLNQLRDLGYRKVKLSGVIRGLSITSKYKL